MKDSDEFSILKKVFKNLGNQYFDSSNLHIGPGDDAGLFKTRKDLIFSTDTSLANVHFPKELEPKLEDMHMSLIRLIDQVRMLDQDMIRLQEKIKVVLEYRERQELLDEKRED